MLFSYQMWFMCCVCYTQSTFQTSLVCLHSCSKLFGKLLSATFSLLSVCYLLLGTKAGEETGSELVQ